MSRLRAYHSLVVAAFLIGPMGFLVPLGVAPLLALTAILALVFKRLEEKAWPHFEKSHLIFLGTFIAYGALSSLWAIDPRASLKQAMILGVMGILSLIILDVSRNLLTAERKQIAKALLISASLVLVLFVIEYFSNGVISRLYRSGPEALAMQKYTRSASFLAVMVWPLLLCIPNGARWYKREIVFGLGALCVLGLENETAQASLVLGLIGYTLVRFIPYGALRYLGALIVICLLAAPALPKTVLNPDIIADKVQSATKEGKVTINQQVNSVHHRLVIWDFTADRIFNKPLGGWGLNSARAIPGGSQITNKLTNAQLLPLHPHNGVLQIWLELGVIGALFLSIFMVFIMRFLRDFHIPKNQKSLIAGGMVVGLVIFSSSYGIWQAWWMSTLIFSGIFFHSLASRN